MGRYLQWGKRELQADKSYLASHRYVWHQPEERDACGIVMPYMNRGLPRFIWNKTGAVPLNTFHVIEPLDAAQTERLWCALNQPAFLRKVQRMGRDYGKGLWKIEPGDLRRLRLVLP